MMDISRFGWKGEIDKDHKCVCVLSKKGGVVQCNIHAPEHVPLLRVRNLISVSVWCCLSV